MPHSYVKKSICYHVLEHLILLNTVCTPPSVSRVFNSKKLFNLLDIFAIPLTQKTVQYVLDTARTPIDSVMVDNYNGHNSFTYSLLAYYFLEGE